MSLIKNKSTLYAVMRVNSSPDSNLLDVICCFTKTLDKAERLCNEYQQQYNDINEDPDTYFQVVANIFYDE